MCLISKYKIKEKLRMLKKSEACASPSKHKFKNTEFCLISVRHVPPLQTQGEGNIEYFQEG